MIQPVVDIQYTQGKQLVALTTTNTWLDELSN